MSILPNCKCRASWLQDIPSRAKLAMLLCAAIFLAGSIRAEIGATLTDIGVNNPEVGADDIYQFGLSAIFKPDDLNYYMDNDPTPGQTFTTGANSTGYVMNSLTLATSGDSGGFPSGGQPYILRIYSVSGDSATLMAAYSSQQFTFGDTDWMQWTGLSLFLQPNTQYAYSFSRTISGWDSMAVSDGDPYPGGEIALIPSAGGTMTFSSSHSYDASFVVGLAPATGISVNPVDVAPQHIVTAGTTVTLSTLPAGGEGPLTYQWQTDGGSGGAFTNIPSATEASFALDTTEMGPGNYQFRVVVQNTTTSATSAATTIQTYTVCGATLSDTGTTIPTGQFDISQLTGGGNGDGLNYYDNNNPPPGQTFTTGSNPEGYLLNGVSIGTGGGTSGHTSENRPYDLRIFQVNGDTATLLLNCTNANFTFVYGDWVSWTGFAPLLLKANTTYAYSFRMPGDGWAAMKCTPATTDVYPGGQLCLVPMTGGTLSYGSTGLSDAAFDLNLTPIGAEFTSPTAAPISVSPSRVVSAGTQVTLAESATGGAPLYYQWQTDGGNGGTLADIPSSNATNLVLDTTAWKPGTYQYNVVVTNSFGSSTASVALVVSYPDANANLADLGAAMLTPSPDDISQTSPATGANTPDGLNYYFNNDTPPGQTFATGNNPLGYTLSSLSISLGGNGGGHPAGGQSYVLRIYSISEGNATLYATFNSQSDFVFASDTDWVRWSGLELPLAPATTYAYTFFGRNGWDNLANISANPYPNGEVCMIPPSGGAVTFASSHDYDAVFVLGLAATGHPLVSPPAFSPSSSVYAGTPVTISANVTGDGPLTYQWQSDDGSGSFTDVQDATTATLTLNTAAMGGQLPIYRLVASNSSGSTTGEGSQLSILPAQLPSLPGTGAYFDITNSLYQVSSQVTTFLNGSVTFSETNFQGTLPITYQWQADGGTGTFTNILGATNALLELSNLKISDSGSYKLLATNSQGAAETAAANLTVLPPPAGSFIANFQFHTLANADVGNYSGPGVIGTGTFWNQVMGPAQFDSAGGVFTSSTGLSDDGSVNRGVSWTLLSDNSWGWTATPNLALLDSAADAYAPNNFLFTLPNGIYNLVLFSCNGTEAGNGEGTVFTVNDVSQTVSPTTDTQFTLNDNYVVYTNIVVTGAKLAGKWAGVKNFGSLNGAQLQYVGPQVSLEIQSAANNQLKLEWSQGTLLEATSVTGPWVTNTAPSPYLVTPNAAQKFYRLKVQ